MASFSYVHLQNIHEKIHENDIKIIFETHRKNINFQRATLIHARVNNIAHNFIGHLNKMEPLSIRLSYLDLTNGFSIVVPYFYHTCNIQEQRIFFCVGILRYIRIGPNLKHMKHKSPDAVIVNLTSQVEHFMDIITIHCLF